MTGLYFLRWPLIIFLIGYVIEITGALFKIRHWPGADEAITVGSIICITAIVFGITKIAFMKKPML